MSADITHHGRLPCIPRHEPEVIQAGARKYWRGCTDKVATTSIRKLIVRGVDISSRYRKAAEFEFMQEIVCALSPTMCRMIGAIFYDSKGGSCDVFLSVGLHGDLSCYDIGRAIEKAAFAHKGGHNGIFIKAANGKHVLEIAAVWGGDL